MADKDHWFLFVLIIYSLWRELDKETGGLFPGSALLRGGLLGIFLLWIFNIGNTKRTDNELKNETYPEKTNNSAKVWLFVIGVVILVIWLAPDQENKNTLPVSAAATQSTQAQTQQSTPSSTNSDNDIALRANDLRNQGRYTESLPLVLQLAEQNNVSWQRLAGTMYAEGLGVYQDINQAFYWYKKAAEQGDADAIAALKKLSKEKNETLYQVQRQPAQTQETKPSSVKKIKRANKNRGDLRNCLSLGSNEAIAQCVGKN